MRQYDFEKDKALDEALHDFGSSPQEARELKEIASMLSDLPRAQSSSSFRSELRASLLEKAQSLSRDAGVDRRKKGSGLFAGIYRFQKKLLPRPFFTAAAAIVVAVVALASFYSYGLVKPGKPGGRASWNPFIAMIGQNEQGGSEQQPVGKEDPSSSTGKEPSSEKGSQDRLPGKQGEPEAEEPDPSAVSPVPGETDEDDPALQDPPPGEQESGEEEGDPGRPEPSESEEEQGASLKPAPVFSVEKNMRSIKLAGKIGLPPVYYNTAGTEALAPVEKVNYSWKPRKIVASTAGTEARTIGTSAWAQEILSDEGFSVREGDLLVTNLQETQKGNFVEIFYNSQKSGEQGPKLILHYEEGKGVIGYYYQEQGGIWQPGFYPLLPPSKAFAQVREVEWYAPAERLDFSFQEVFLTYHDFPVLENSRQKTQRLPAYCFLGRETFRNGSEFKLYLLAVP